MTPSDAGESGEGNDRTTATLSERLSAGLDRFTGRFDPLSRGLDRGGRRSRFVAFLGRCARGVERSRIVRWLTREPDPDVIVIDLTESSTIGPVLRVLDRMAAALAAPARASRIRRATTRAVATVEENAVPFASAVLLGVVLATLALTWKGAGPLWLAALAIAGVAGLLGLGVDRSGAALRDSTVRRWAVATVAPPDDRSR